MKTKELEIGYVYQVILQLYYPVGGEVGLKKLGYELVEIFEDKVLVRKKI